MGAPSKDAMTYNQVTALTAGSDIDAYVAEKVMSYTWGLSSLTGYTSSVYCLSGASPKVPTVPPSYSSDLSQAMLVAEAASISIEWASGNANIVVSADSGTYSLTITDAANLPLTICKVALLQAWTLTP